MKRLKVAIPAMVILMEQSVLAASPSTTTTSESLLVPLGCDVQSQKNDPADANDPMFSVMNYIRIEDSYKPYNVLVDGNSANDRLMENEIGPEDVAGHTSNYMKVVNKGRDISISMENDRSTFALYIDLTKIGQGDNALYYGSVHLREWYDVYAANVSCKPIPKTLCLFGNGFQELLSGSVPNIRVIDEHHPSRTMSREMLALTQGISGKHGLTYSGDESFYLLESAADKRRFLAVDQNDNGYIDIYAIPDFENVASYDHSVPYTCSEQIPNPAY